MRIALVHDWIIEAGGAEACLAEFYSIFDKPDIFTLFFSRQSADKLGFSVTNLKGSFLQRLPKVLSYYRYTLPLWPFAIEQFDVTNYDLILSSSHAVAKGVITRPEQIHICYCYTPMRYAWDLYFVYLNQVNLDRGLRAFFIRAILHYMRLWDVSTVNRVDYFIAISNYVARRIKRHYRRDAIVIYPPVDLGKFSIEEKKEDFYVTVSRLVPYKRVDLIVEAFSQMKDRKLIVIGDGPEMREIKSLATKNIEILGPQPFEQVRKYISKARAFLFASEEDFGIAPVEAQACGTPVIAYGKGGVLETVIEGKTGIFFYEQSPHAIIEAVMKFEEQSEQFLPSQIASTVERFSSMRFRNEIQYFVRSLLK